MSEYFPEPISFEEAVKVELDLSGYVKKKTDLKNATVFNAPNFPEEAALSNWKSNEDKLDIDKWENVPTNLSNLKRKVDKLDADKLLPVLVDLSRLSDVVKNDVVKKNVYNAKIQNIEDKIPDFTNLATNLTLNAKINGVKHEIHRITNLASTTALNAKINEAENVKYIKTPNITNLATTTALTVFENIIPNVSNLVMKTNYNTEVSEIENTDHDHYKYITTQEFNKLTSEIFSARLAETNLASKSDIADRFWW